MGIESIFYNNYRWSITFKIVNHYSVHGHLHNGPFLVVVQWSSICLPMQEMRVRFLGREDALEKEMATHSSIVAWETPWMPARLLCPWKSPGKNNTMGSLSLLQGLFLTQGLNPGPLHCRQILYHISQLTNAITGD